MTGILVALALVASITAAVNMACAHHARKAKREQADAADFELFPHHDVDPFRDLEPHHSTESRWATKPYRGP